MVFFFLKKLDNREPWFQSRNIDARINDGVVAVSLANANKVPTYRKNICQQNNRKINNRDILAYKKLSLCYFLKS